MTAVIQRTTPHPRRQRELKYWINGHSVSEEERDTDLSPFPDGVISASEEETPIQQWMALAHIHVSTSQ